jgi:iron-sulfur cluster repair protein YtfE (RIC family)
MTPREVRAHILADHVAIRGMLLSLESVADRVRGGDRSLVAVLRVEGEALLRHLQQHMLWEDRHFAPALRRADTSGEERAARLDSDHREQRQVLAHCLSAVNDESRPASVVARTLIDLVAMLREDIEDEERLLLDERVLRDDAIGIDVETG